MSQPFLVHTQCLRAFASLTILGLLSACSSDASPGNAAGGAPAGTSGASGVSGSAGALMSAAGSGGQTAVAGSAGSVALGGGGSGGMSQTGGSSGNAGAAGSSAGSGGAAAGAGGSGPVGFWGPNGPKKQWSCPAPPYGTQTKGPAVPICVGFKYNYNYNEGPTWIASQNAFFFSNFAHSMNKGGDIIKYTPGGQCEVFLHDVACNGLGVSPSGNILAACQGERAVMEYDVLTKKGRVIASMANGKMLDSPNDLIARSDGNVYFSNTTYELGGQPQGLGAALVRVDPLGVVSVVEAGDLNGVALSPDETKLYVVGKGVFPLDAAGLPGKKGGGDPGGDGIAVDCAGAISITGTNSAFGGADGKTLIAVGPDTQAKTYQMTVPGLP